MRSSSLLYPNHQDRIKVSAMILKELGRNLPDSLEYLDLSLHLNPRDLQTFSNDCKNDGRLKTLLIRDRSCDFSCDTLDVLKEFVKEKGLESLSYRIESFDRKTYNRVGSFDGKTYVSLEGLVKEILTFVQMKKYEDLVVKISDF